MYMVDHDTLQQDGDHSKTIIPKVNMQLGESVEIHKHHHCKCLWTIPVNHKNNLYAILLVTVLDFFLKKLLLWKKTVKKVIK